LSFQANLNGFLSFNEMVMNSSIPDPFPARDIMVVATFWNDIVTLGDRGDVFLRPSNDPTDLNKASLEIRQHFVDMSEFSATWIFVVSWNRVAYYRQGNLVWFKFILMLS